ncbi:transposase [Spirosoma agri]|uniref:Transposase n=1 Tax=Spirosoma agri TaxID=1987381 RepID=A0A6M0IG68_9BACT|nr:transposase [Spirosoma agri]NEU67280.1 transposase [Spirosoma agri]
MNVESGQLYHVYNRGNNRQRLFFRPENYLYFLRKLRKHLLPTCDLLAYCLMPNHFHFLIATFDENSPSGVDNAYGSDVFRINQAIAVILRSYTRAINIQECRTGSLLQQETKAKWLDKNQYVAACLHYIHQNPMRASLSERLEDWPYSSYLDYAGLRNGTLCNQQVARLVLPVDFDNFLDESFQVIDPDLLKELRFS